MKHYYIYLTTNLINGKIYIGKRTARTKTIEADYKYLGSGKLIRHAIKKYGKENFKKEILEVCTKENLSVREKYYIELYNCRNIETGYNIIEGGYGVGDLCHDRKTYYNPETDEEIRIKETETPPKGFKHGRRPFSEITRKHLAKPGSLNGMFGSHRIGKENPFWGITFIVNIQTGEKQTWAKKDPLPKGYDYCPSYYVRANKLKTKIKSLNKKLSKITETKRIIELKADLYIIEKNFYEYTKGISYEIMPSPYIKETVETKLKLKALQKEESLVKRQKRRKERKEKQF